MMRLNHVVHRPVLSTGEVASALVDLQGALARTLALILFHPVKNKRVTIRTRAADCGPAGVTGMCSDSTSH